MKYKCLVTNDGPGCLLRPENTKKISLLTPRGLLPRFLSTIILAANGYPFDIGVKTEVLCAKMGLSGGRIFLLPMLEYHTAWGAYEILALYANHDMCEAMVTLEMRVYLKDESGITDMARQGLYTFLHFTLGGMGKTKQWRYMGKHASQIPFPLWFPTRPSCLPERSGPDSGSPRSGE